MCPQPMCNAVLSAEAMSRKKFDISTSHHLTNRHRSVLVLQSEPTLATPTAGNSSSKFQGGFKLQAAERIAL